MKQTQYAIEAADLTRKFGDLAAVDHINFKVEEGELWGPFGSNGAGKTTTVKWYTVCSLQPMEVERMIKIRERWTILSRTWLSEKKSKMDEAEERLESTIKTYSAS